MNTMTTYIPTAPAIKPLGDYGVLVSLSINLPEFKVKDKNVNRQVAYQHNADESLGDYRKCILDCPELTAIKELRNEIRRYYYDNTVACGKGTALLPNPRLLEFKNTMDNYLREYAQMKETLIRAVPSHYARMQIGLGDLFDPSQYPSLEDLERKVNISVRYTEMPTSGALSDIHRQAQESLRDEFAKSAQDERNALSRDLWERLRKPLENMSSMLVDKEVGKPMGFKGTIVDNVLEIVELMKICNVGDDPRMEQVRVDLKRALTGVTFQGLKTSETMRERTKAEVDKIIDNLPSLGF